MVGVDRYEESPQIILNGEYYSTIDSFWKGFTKHYHASGSSELKGFSERFINQYSILYSDCGDVKLPEMGIAKTFLEKVVPTFKKKGPVRTYTRLCTEIIERKE